MRILEQLEARTVLARLLLRSLGSMRSYSLFEYQGLKISWLGHDSFRIKNGKTVIIDPFKIRPIPEKADILMITHEHYDHLSIDDIKKVVNENTTIVTIPAVKKELSSLKVKEVKAVKPGFPSERGWKGRLHHRNQRCQSLPCGGYGCNPGDERAQSRHRPAPGKRNLRNDGRGSSSSGENGTAKTGNTNALRSNSWIRARRTGVQTVSNS